MITNLRRLTLGTPLVYKDDTGVKTNAYFQTWFRNDGHNYIIAGQYNRVNDEPKGSIIASVNKFRLADNVVLKDRDCGHIGFKIVTHDVSSWILNKPILKKPYTLYDKTEIYASDGDRHKLDKALSKGHVYILDELTIFGFGSDADPSLERVA